MSSPHILTGSAGSITRVAGIEVGHFTDTRRPTGCTVVMAREGAVGGVDVRGAAPGTRETDLLDPCNLVEKVHAIVLAGGSAWGLEAATGAVRWLEERGVGFDVSVGRLPIVPAAVLFDLLVGDMRIRPDAAAGYAACDAASATDPAEGNVGAGTGAAVGKIFGMQRAMKGGIGTASVTVEGVTVGALIACNALGDVVDPDTAQVIAGARTDDGLRLRDTRRALLRGEAPQPLLAGTNTTIGGGGHGCCDHQGAGPPAGGICPRRPGAQHQPGAHHVRRRHAFQPGNRPGRQERGDDGLGHDGRRGHGHRHGARCAGGPLDHDRRGSASALGRGARLKQHVPRNPSPKGHKNKSHPLGWLER
ncbi:peptidase S58, DmpA [Acidovorax sp. NO-1]|nr:peptidase S58, DmpA [Acidovorax sp. NO-1]